jgi:hypothetical protein
MERNMRCFHAHFHRLYTPSCLITQNTRTMVVQFYMIFMANAARVTGNKAPVIDVRLDT